MSKNRKKAAKSDEENAKPAAAKGPAITLPVDVVDGIPDRAAKRPIWKYLVLLAIFLAWVGFLIYCLNAGAIKR